MAQKIKDVNAELLIVGGHFDESIDMRRALKQIDWYPKAFLLEGRKQMNPEGFMTKSMRASPIGHIASAILVKAIDAVDPETQRNVR